MRFGFKSDKGVVRKINEDSYNIIRNNDGIPYCFIVADGMGGHNSGEVASKMAVDLVTEAFNDDWKISGIQIADKITEVIRAANRIIYENSIEHAENHGMGTTIIVSVLHKDKVIIGHVGDSRVYLIRNNTILKITTDHSFIEELVNKGTLTREEAEMHPKKNVITRAVGYEDDVSIDIYESDFFDGDIFLLCTDGLTNKLSETEIFEIVNKSDELQTACERLVAGANKKGGEDNITVLTFSR